MEDSSAELAWAAGFFEQGGCTTRSSGRARVAVKQAVESLGLPPPNELVQFASALGCGVIRGPYTERHRDGRRRKPIYYWYADGEERSVEAISRLWPFLSTFKRVQAKRVLGKLLLP